MGPETQMFENMVINSWGISHGALMIIESKLLVVYVVNAVVTWGSWREHVVVSTPGYNYVTP